MSSPIVIVGPHSMCGDIGSERGRRARPSSNIRSSWALSGGVGSGTRHAGPKAAYDLSRTLRVLGSMTVQTAFELCWRLPFAGTRFYRFRAWPFSRKRPFYGHFKRPTARTAGSIQATN